MRNNLRKRIENLERGVSSDEIVLTLFKMKTLDKYPSGYIPQIKDKETCRELGLKNIKAVKEMTKVKKAGKKVDIWTFEIIY